MDFSKLDQNEKLATYGSIAVIIGAIVGGTVSALGWLALLAAIGMLAVVFLPQFSPQTNLPGSKGSLMLLLGAIAGVILVLGLLSVISLLGYWFQLFALNAIFFLIAVVGGVVMAWAGWKAFQAEGGKFALGTSGMGTTAAAAPPADATPAAPPVTPEPPVAPEPPVTPEPPVAGEDQIS